MSFTIGTLTVGSRARNGAHDQTAILAPATSAGVGVVAIGTDSSTAVIVADVGDTGRRSILITNTGTTPVELSPAASFGWGTGFPLAAGASLNTDYNGAIYARVQSGTGELRWWAES